MAAKPVPAPHSPPGLGWCWADSLPASVLALTLPGPGAAASLSQRPRGSTAQAASRAPPPRPRGPGPPQSPAPVSTGTPRPPTCHSTKADLLRSRRQHILVSMIWASNASLSSLICEWGCFEDEVRKAHRKPFSSVCGTNTLSLFPSPPDASMESHTGLRRCSPSAPPPP